MKIDIKVVLLDGSKHTRHVHAPAHRRFTAAGVEHVLKLEAERVEQFFPDREFRLVPLRGCAFNFVEIKPEITAEVLL